MPIAELRGKSGPEDTLTSSAFGLLTVLPSWCLSEWLTHAERLDGAVLAVPESPKIDALFWPQLDDGEGTCEPDVLLSLSDDVGHVLGVLVEVKYRSDMSGWPTPVEQDSAVRGQLGREWLALHSTPARNFPGRPLALDRRVLVYVTTGATLPNTTFEACADELEKKGGEGDGFRERAYWVSWFALSEIARHALNGGDVTHVERVALARLLELLVARKLCAFSAIEPPPLVPPNPWRYTPNPSVYPTSPSPHAVEWSYTKGQEVIA